MLRSRRSLEEWLQELDSSSSPCTLCGMCDPHCATWNVKSEALEGPKGRIQLAQSLLHGRVMPADPLMHSFDRCLDCGLCETYCPSGVSFHRVKNAVMHVRAQLADSTPKSSTWKGRFFRTILRIPLLRRFLGAPGTEVPPENALYTDKQLELFCLESKTHRIIPEMQAYYWPPCCGLKNPDTILAALQTLSGLTLIPLPQNICCGGAHYRFWDSPAQAQALASAACRFLRPEVPIIAGSLPCYLQLKKHSGLCVMHPMELLSKP